MVDATLSSSLSRLYLRVEEQQAVVGMQLATTVGEGNYDNDLELWV